MRPSRNPIIRHQPSAASASSLSADLAHVRLLRSLIPTNSFVHSFTHSLIRLVRPWYRRHSLITLDLSALSVPSSVSQPDAERLHRQYRTVINLILASQTNAPVRPPSAARSLPARPPVRRAAQLVDTSRPTGVPSHYSSSRPPPHHTRCIVPCGLVPPALSIPQSHACQPPVEGLRWSDPPPHSTAPHHTNRQQSPSRPLSPGFPALVLPTCVIRQTLLSCPTQALAPDGFVACLRQLPTRARAASVACLEAAALYSPTSNHNTNRPT